LLIASPLSRYGATGGDNPNDVTRSIVSYGVSHQQQETIIYHAKGLPEILPVFKPILLDEREGIGKDAGCQ
jgi:hypothetical protein